MQTPTPGARGRAVRGGLPKCRRRKEQAVLQRLQRCCGGGGPTQGSLDRGRELFSSGRGNPRLGAATSSTLMRLARSAFKSGIGIEGGHGSRNALLTDAPVGSQALRHEPRTQVRTARLMPALPQ